MAIGNDINVFYPANNIPCIFPCGDEIYIRPSGVPECSPDIDLKRGGAWDLEYHMVKYDNR